MLPDRTTTMGEGELVATERPFQSMNAVLRIRAKLRVWVRSWRGWRVENIVVWGGVGRREEGEEIGGVVMGGLEVVSFAVCRRHAAWVT